MDIIKNIFKYIGYIKLFKLYMIFTKEQLDSLYEAEIHFDNACHRGCIRNVPAWLTERVVNIFREATNKKLTYKKGCSTCVMNIMKTVGYIYFEDKAELAKLSAMEPIAEISQAEALLAEVPQAEEAQEKPKRSKKKK